MNEQSEIKREGDDGFLDGRAVIRIRSTGSAYRIMLVKGNLDPMDVRMKVYEAPLSETLESLRTFAGGQYRQWASG